MPPRRGRVIGGIAAATAASASAAARSSRWRWRHTQCVADASRQRGDASTQPGQAPIITGRAPGATAICLPTCRPLGSGTAPRAHRLRRSRPTLCIIPPRTQHLRESSVLPQLRCQHLVLLENGAQQRATVSRQPNPPPPPPGRQPMVDQPFSRPCLDMSSRHQHTCSMVASTASVCSWSTSASGPSASLVAVSARVKSLRPATCLKMNGGKLFR
jgi:hypothetical protein